MASMDEETESVEQDQDEDYDDEVTSYFTEAVSQIDPPPPPTGIDFFPWYFERLGDPCPTFFHDSLLDACNVAFETPNEDRRPLLVYIHHKRATFTNIFCSEIFSSKSIIDYLRNNYIVWPFDITEPEDAGALMQTWAKLFGHRFFDRYKTEDFPMLIAVRRAAIEEKKRFSPPDYRHELLMKGDQVATKKSVLNELTDFKEKFDQNEVELTFSIQESCGLCWDVIVEISKYLTLNDSVKAFSPDFVREIKREGLPVHISNKPEVFLSLLTEPFDANRVRTLRLNLDGTESIFDLCKGIFVHRVQSLHLLNIERIGQISDACKRFGPVEHLSLWFNDQSLVDEGLRQVFCSISPNIHLEIHCPRVICHHTRSGRFNDGYFADCSAAFVKSLLFDFTCSQLPSTGECITDREACFIESIASRMRYMYYIEAIRFRVRSADVEKFLFADVWRSTFARCARFERITIRLVDTPPDEAILKKAATIEKDLRSIRREFRFRIKSI